MSTAAPQKFNHHTCTLCGNVNKIQHVEPAPGVKGAVAVDISRCPICDVRKCKKGHYTQNMRARRCAEPGCGEYL